MTKRPIKLSAEIERALADTGLPWEIKPPSGLKHHKVMLNGRLVLSFTPGKDAPARGMVRNVVASIRRVARESGGPTR